MKQFIFLFLAIMLEVVGTSGLKASAQFTKLVPSVITVIAYVKQKDFCPGTGTEEHMV